MKPEIGEPATPNLLHSYRSLFPHLRYLVNRDIFGQPIPGVIVIVSKGFIPPISIVMCM